MKVSSFSLIAAVFSSLLCGSFGSSPNPVKKQHTRPAFTVEKHADAPENHTKKKSALKKLSFLKGGASLKPKTLVRIGDAGNVLTAVLSVVLLMRTPFNINPCDPPRPCQPSYSDTGGGLYPASSVSDPLDKCYVCDGFCITNPESHFANSHMLSLYVDFLLTVPLLMLHSNNLSLLQDLKLDDYLLSKFKMTSVAGHGIAHLSLSVLALGLSPQSQALAAKIGSNPLSKIIPAGFVIWALTSNIKFYAETVAPLVGGAVLGIQQANKLLAEAGATSSILEYLVFGVPCYIFFSAGIPKSDPRRPIISLAATAIATLLSVNVLKVQTPANSFVVVFTAAYLVSALYQVVFWDKEEKEERAVPYAVTAWSSNLLTTLVGWALARGCTDLLGAGGHMLYDLSIPVSYFIIFYLTKMLSQ